MRLPPFKRSERTKRKVSDAKLGHEVSEETRKKISEKLKGRKHTEEAREKISAAMKGRKRKTDAELVAEVKRDQFQDRQTSKRLRIWREDMAEALRMGSRALFEDVRQSQGYTYRRKYHDPSGRVSDGCATNGRRSRKEARLQKVRRAGMAADRGTAPGVGAAHDDRVRPPGGSGSAHSE